MTRTRLNIKASKVEYPLPEIMLVVLRAPLAGAGSFVEIARWGRMKLAFLRQLLGLRTRHPVSRRA